MKSIIVGIILCIVFFSVIQNAEAKTWQVYLNPMPKQWESHFGNIYYEATAYWEKRVPGTYFTEINQREKADFVVQWSSQFQGSRLGYYTSSSNNDLGRPYIAITLGYMDDESVKFQDRKFNLVDAEYAKLITTHELGHAIGFDHSTNRNDIMYPSIYDYKSWIANKKQPVPIRLAPITDTTKMQYHLQSVSYQTSVNQNIESLKQMISQKEDKLYSQSFTSLEASLAYQKAIDALNISKEYLANAEWTQKEGEKLVGNKEYEKAYYKYVYSDSMIKQAKPYAGDVDTYLGIANGHEKKLQENKPVEIKEFQEQPIEKIKTCFLFWCW